MVSDYIAYRTRRSHASCLRTLEQYQWLDRKRPKCVERDVSERCERPHRSKGNKWTNCMHKLSYPH